jgi:hypothetical protein
VPISQRCSPFKYTYHAASTDFVPPMSTVSMNQPCPLWLGS